MNCRQRRHADGFALTGNGNARNRDPKTQGLLDRAAFRQGGGQTAVAGIAHPRGIHNQARRAREHAG